MCRSIRKLRRPEGLPPSEEIAAAALQYVRKVSGFRSPSRANREAFDSAARAITAATADLLATLEASRRSRVAPRN